jgi:hypothetical protein
MSGWPKRITVDRRIISILSSSTYENFPHALKEIIVNSYDADATRVDLRIERESELITVEDNGKGMSEDDFEFYLRIAGKSRKKSTLSDGGRRIVGKFGVGFLAVFPFCRIYEIESTRRGSSELIKAKIDCEKYFTFHEGSTVDVDNVPIYGGVTNNESLRNKQYTKIRLVGFTDLMRSFFLREYETNKRNSVKRYPPLKLIEWVLREYLPIKYKANKLNEIFHLNHGLAFQVFFNKKELFRHKHISKILESHSGEFKKIGNIKFRYLIGTSFEPLSPSEARYILIRNFNVGVGKRETFGIGLDGRLYAKLAWLSIDVDVVEGLNDLIAVSRDRFNFSPDYEQFKEFFRQKLRFWSEALNNISDLDKLIQSDNDKRRILDFDDEKEIRKEKIIKSLERKGINIELEKTSLSDKKSEKKSLGEKIEIQKHRKDDFQQEKDLFKPENHTPSFERPIKENEGQNKLLIQIDEPKKESTILIDEKVYEIEFKTWQGDELYPACKIIGSKIIINKGYRLFQNKPFLDVFIKFHFLMVLNHQNGIIDSKTLIEINRSFNKIFFDYR